MLVIGHRGAKALAAENTLEALQAGVDSGALMLEFDVQLTSDDIPVIIHGSTLLRTHGVRQRVSNLPLTELRKLTKNTVPTLEEVLIRFWGKVHLNIELKGRNTGRIVTQLIQSKFIQHTTDWENCLLSSFKVRELKAARHTNHNVQLALLHNRNPFVFIAYTRQLRLTAVGFHRLYVNPLAVDIAKKSKLFTYAYTVNRPKAALLMAQKNIDAVVTDNPASILSIFSNND